MSPEKSRFIQKAQEETQKEVNDMIMSEMLIMLDSLEDDCAKNKKNNKDNKKIDAINKEYKKILQIQE